MYLFLFFSAGRSYRPLRLFTVAVKFDKALPDVALANQWRSKPAVSRKRSSEQEYRAKPKTKQGAKISQTARLKIGNSE